MVIFVNVDFNKNIVISPYMVELSSFWHHRLGHVNFRRLHDMVKIDLLSYFETSQEKCTICKLTKITRNPFPKVNVELVLESQGYICHFMHLTC